LLIGAERGWRMREEPPGGRVAGIRTFSLIGLLGGLAGLIAGTELNIIALLLAGGAVLALLLGYRADMQKDGNVSATSTLAAIITLLLGALAAAGYFAIASVGAGVTVALLASREGLHKLVRYTSESDLKALVRLALVVFLILPVLPDANIGPYGLNPQRLWYVVVIIGSVNFIGYILTRWLGDKRGTLLTALFGAMVSSTAVTIYSARRLREAGAKANFADQTGVSLASTVMLARTLILVSILAPLALNDVADLVGPAFLLSLAAALVFAWFTRGADQKTEGAPANLKAPGLSLAFLFAALVAFISIMAGWVQQHVGDDSGAVVIALGGMVDVDSAIGAIGAMPPSVLSAKLAALAIATPVMFNTLLKLALLVAIAGVRQTKWAAANLAATAAILGFMIAGIIL
jgi:uncharacterized membrane protein (DUF4010 family)